LKPLIFEKIAKSFGKSEVGGGSIGGICPGEGFCERITGMTGTPQENFEEASPGCPNKCQSLRQTGEEIETDESDADILQIENLFDEHSVFPFSSERIENLEYFEQECLIFWQKITAQFERECSTTLRIFAEAHFKKWHTSESRNCFNRS
ncbi:MAG TPA: hypothetical protein PKE69_27320, partial [Pyrinomonadaceae bacterium]|nr:hypothetical protein [Pyrinomonadaceae bacterium]